MNALEKDVGNSTTDCIVRLTVNFVITLKIRNSFYPSSSTIFWIMMRQFKYIQNYIQLEQDKYTLLASKEVLAYKIHGSF